MRKITIWKDPYDCGFNTCEADEVEFDTGLTVLVGCNGLGKTTMLSNIKTKLEDESIPYVKFNNLHEGGHSSLSEQAFRNNWDMVSQMYNSSEGENIVNNLGMLMVKMHKFISTGETKQDGIDLSKLLSDEESEPITSKERWVLLDAIDSGLSIDNVWDLKGVFKLMQEDAEKLGMDLYIIVSANEYELASGETCLDIVEGKKITFDSYQAYSDYIRKTREIKDKRYEED